MVHITLEYVIKMRSGFHIGTGYGLAGVVDKRTVRGEDGFIYIPGSSIKGRVKIYYRDIAQRLGLTICENGSLPKCSLCTVFGSPKIEGSLVFNDARVQYEPVKWSELEKDYEHRLLPLFDMTLRTNVMLNRKTKLALGEHLYTSEISAPGLEFYGFIDGQLRPTQILAMGSDQIPLEIPLLAASLQLIIHLGGGKSRGLGHCSVSTSKVIIDGKPFTNIKDILDLLN